MPRHDSKISTIMVENAAFLPEVVRLIGEGHTVTLPLRGFSMRPFLEDRRDKAVLSAPGTPRKGDVVLAEIAPGCYVLHRIIAVEEYRIILQGDGNLTAESCPADGIKAVAIGFYRKGRSKLEPTSGLKWRAYSALWMRLRPARRYLLAIHRLFSAKQQR